MRQIKEKSPERGAALVELAMVLPLLLLILMGIVEIGLLFYNQQVLTNASREGARSAIARIDVNNIVLDENGVREIVMNYLGLGSTDSDVDRRLITFGTGPSPDVNTVGLGGAYGDDLTVTVGYDYNFLVPKLLGLGTSLHLSAETIMRMERFIPPPSP